MPDGSKLTWDEIKRKYPDEWVVVVDFSEEGCELTEGVVVDHGRVKDEVYSRLDKVPSPAALRFTGELRGGLYGFHVEEVDGEGQS